ncbi:unnamed protein product [Ectocarpus sp. CCAP 1310/34]|nr:unnamed protein product [Ectocarpus sp. CCAP 1310/34]
MEQGLSNGSRSSGDHPTGSSASTRAEGNGGDSSVEKVTKSNQDEEEEGDDRSAYGSEDFDDQSKRSAAESEVGVRRVEAYDSRDYGFGEDDRSSTNSPTTADGSQTQTTGTAGEDGEVQARNEAVAGESIATGGGALDEHNNSLSSYGEDDFADDDSTFPPTQEEVISTPPPSDRPLNAAGVAAASNVDGNVTNRQQERGEQSTDDPAAAAGVTASPSPSFNQPDTRNSKGEDKGSADTRTAGGKNGDRYRQESASDRGDGVGNDRDATINPRGAGGVVKEVDDKDRPMGSLPPVTELEERLRQANLENARLREAVERKTAATAGSADDGGAKKELEVLKHQVEAARAVMLSSLADGEDKPERTLLELVLLAESQGYKQAEKVCTHIPHGGGGSRRRKSSAAEATAAATAAVKAESIARAALEKRVESLERDLARAGQESRAQSARAASLQRQLDGGGNGGDQSGSGQSGNGGVAGGVGVVVNSGGGLDDVTIGVATADIMALKVKATQLVERLRHEKSARLKAERKTQKVAGKVRAAAAVVQVLSDHIEKLMMFLKHEATQKAKAHEQQRRLQKELELARSTALLRSNQAKDRVTTELREGSKILEDQLRLMDEKYMELRTKLDWTRTKADKDVRRARAQASALRTKWAILCGDGEGGGGSSLLDTMQVDVAPGPRLNHSSSAPGTAAAGGGRGGLGAAGHNNNHGAAAGGHSPKFASNNGQQHGGGPSRAGVGSPPIARGGGGGGGGGGKRGVQLSRGGQGPLAPSTSDPSFLRRRQIPSQRGGFGGVNSSLKMVGGGGGGGGKNAAVSLPGYAGGRGAARGGSSPGGLSAGLSAGTDPGGELLSDMGTGTGGNGGGGQRPPWSEQGGGRGARDIVSNKILYA